MNLLVLGDSIALGAEATSGDKTFVEILADRLGACTTYFCRGGATSATGAEWCDFLFQTPPSDLVVVSYGMNDQTLARIRFKRRVQVEPMQYQRNVQRIIRAARMRGTNAILLVAPPPPHPDWEGDSGRTHEYRDALMQCGEAVADVPSHWGDRRALIVNGMNHPGDDGHRLIAEACLAAIPAAIADRG